MIKLSRSFEKTNNEKRVPMKHITLDKIVVDKNKVNYFFHVKELQKYFKNTNHLFFEYNYELADIPDSVLTIPFVANVIPLIWITDSILEVDELDKSFYECLNIIREAYQDMYPNVRFKGGIVVKKIIENTYTPEIEAASLFSGGLDALTTYIRLRDKRPLLITEYGWHGENIQYSDVWESDKNNAINFAKSNGLENILIQSNYGTFLKAHEFDRDFNKKLGDSWWHGLHHSLAIISAAIPVAFKLKVSCIYIASSDSPLYKKSCASSPTVDNEIRYASGRVFHDANGITRQEKTKIVANHYSSENDYVNIRVCFRNEVNCCKCEKCLRTLLGLVAEGKNPRNFGFDIPNNLSEHVKEALNNEVKFFTDTFINIYWKAIQKRMRENYQNIEFKDLLEWFLDYDFVSNRKKSLLKYRVTNFFPIIKRKISTKLNLAVNK